MQDANPLGEYHGRSDHHPTRRQILNGWSPNPHMPMSLRLELFRKGNPPYGKQRAKPTSNLGRLAQKQTAPATCAWCEERNTQPNSVTCAECEPEAIELFALGKDKRRSPKLKDLSPGQLRIVSASIKRGIKQ